MTAVRVGEVIILVGSLFTLLAAAGMIRFHDVFARMHALSKANVFGVVLVLLGAAIALRSANDITTLVVAAALQLLTSPVASNMVSLATYWAEGIDREVHTVDELDRDFSATQEHAGPQE